MNTNVIYSFLSRHRHLLSLAIGVLTLIMLTLTLLPADMLAQNKIFSYDKIGHLLMFGSWTFLLGLYHNVSGTGNTNLWIIFSIGLLFGVLIELLQYSFPALNRHADVYDVVFDAIGSLLAVFLLKLIIPRK